MKIKQLSISLLILITAALSGRPNPTPIFSVTKTRQTTQETTLALKFTTQKNVGIIADSITFALKDAPNAKINNWKSSEKTEECLLEGHEGTTACFMREGTLQISILHTQEAALKKGRLTVRYKTNNSPESQTIELPLSSRYAKQEKTLSFWQRIQKRSALFLNQVKETISNLVEHAQSPALQILLILLLGLLMSLTPCIYPMIPITIGIIQSNKAQTLGRNFILACAYAIGIATTFALMGFLVAMGGAQFGSLLGKPLFILFIVLFLGYFAGSMFGFYEVKLPQFGGANIKSNGSLSSAFIFGTISGTVTSPCLSPGLVLVLGIVAKLKATSPGLLPLLQSSLLGFTYLFAFGIGLSIPLVLIATFSGAADKLPRSGLWMVEVKKIFGFLLIALCFGYLQPLVTPAIFFTIIGITLLTIGTLLFRHKTYGAGSLLKAYILLINILTLTTGIYFVWQGIQKTLTPESIQIQKLLNIEQAIEKAREENVPYVLIEFGATWCSLCNKIKAQIMHNDEYKKALGNVVFAHCDCTKADSLEVQAYQKEYGISQGLPVLILISSKDKTILRRWRSEILKLNPEQLAEQVNSL